MKSANIVCVGGTRPNFVKLAPLIQALDLKPELRCFLIHSGQHYHPALDRNIFFELGLRKPDHRFPHVQLDRTQRLLFFEHEFTKIFQRSKPDCVIVVGDVDTSLAAARVAAKFSILTCHIEAGLRSFEIDLPEEINRVEIDHLSHVFYTTEETANRNLINEGVSEARIRFVGNLMADTLLANSNRIPNREAFFEDRKLPFLDNYAIATLHRAANVDCDTTIREWGDFLMRLSAKIPIIWPVHPRVSPHRLKNIYEAISRTNTSIYLTDPFSYLEMQSALRSSAFVLTDSGGLQEEALILGTSCFTVRKQTERPVTLTSGLNTLVGDIFPEIDVNLFPVRRLCHSTPKPELWDGKTAERITSDLSERLKFGGIVC